MSSTLNEEQAVLDATRTCTNNQSMIDLTSKHLEELRTQCASTDKITQQEIKEAETKLIHLVGNQLVAKEKLNCDPIPEVLREYPKLELWLRIVGIPENAIKEILDKGMTFSDLLHMEKEELANLLVSLDCSDLQIKTLLTAFNNLRTCTEKLLQGQPASGHDWHFTDLACLQAAAVAATAAARSATNSPAVGSSPKHQQQLQPNHLQQLQQQRTGSSSSSLASISSTALPTSGGILDSLTQSEHGTASDHYQQHGGHHYQYPYSQQQQAPPRSQPSSPLPSPRAYNGSPSSHRSKSVSSPAVKYPITPPPSKNYTLFPDSNSITKSKSHESQLANKVVDIDRVKGNKKNKPQSINIKLSTSHEALYRRRLSTEGSEAGSRGPSGHSSPVISSPIRSPPYKHDPNAVLIADEHSKYSSNTLTVPRSPKTPMKIIHQTYHRFANTFKITTCDYCHKQMILGYKCKDCKLTPSMFVLAPCDLCMTFAIRGKACKVCKKKFHKDCAQRAPPTCGLSDATLNTLRDWQDSPNSQRRVTKANILSPTALEDMQSLKPVKSMPNFPGGALPDSGSNTSSCNSSSPSSPAYQQTSSDTITSPSPAPSPFTHTQFNFPDVVSTLPIDFMSIGDHRQTDSPDTDVVSTNTSNGSDKTLIDSNASEMTLLDRVDSVDSQDDPFIWNRQNSLAATMKEWDIPFEDLHVKEAIGKGRIGTVYKGVWHGDVAIKVLDTGSSADNDAQLAAFKLE
ncbi:kinase suppressor of ras, partial [Plakobranchus ocellatus]